VDLVDHVGDARDGLRGVHGVVLDGLDALGAVVGRPGRLLRQLLDLVGDDGEALARVAGPRRLDQGVQGKQERLVAGRRLVDEVPTRGPRRLASEEQVHINLNVVQDELDRRSGPEKG